MRKPAVLLFQMDIVRIAERQDRQYRRRWMMLIFCYLLALLGIVISG